MGRVRRQNIAPCESIILFSWADFSALPTLKICVQKGACALQNNAYAPKRLWAALTCSPASPSCACQTQNTFKQAPSYSIDNMQTQFLFYLYKYEHHKKRLLKSPYTTYLFYVEASLHETSNRKNQKTINILFFASHLQGEPSR